VLKAWPGFCVFDPGRRKSKLPRRYQRWRRAPCPFRESCGVASNARRPQQLPAQPRRNPINTSCACSGLRTRGRAQRGLRADCQALARISLPTDTASCSRKVRVATPTTAATFFGTYGKRAVFHGRFCVGVRLITGPGNALPEFSRMEPSRCLHSCPRIITSGYRVNVSLSEHPRFDAIVT
jgi:hypothetical protein